MHLRLLNSVARFTHHRDTDALDHSLTLTLAELSCAREVSLYKNAGESGAQRETFVRCTRDGNGKLMVEPTVLCEQEPDDRALLSCAQQCACDSERGADGSYRLLVAIHRDGVHIGALRLQHNQPLEPIRALVESFARIYANYIGLINESERDKLTGLYNRRTFDRHLRRLLLQVRQRPDRDAAFPFSPGLLHDPRADHADQLWLAIADIDHFKRVNDTYGHLYGDEVILLLAQQMCASFRQRDVLFRFGGEEFVVLLSASDESAAHAALERFRARVASHAFPQIGPLTVSIGFARVGQQDYPTSVLDRADKALYFAKKSGRNRLFGYEALRARGELGKDLPVGSVDLF